MDETGVRIVPSNDSTMARKGSKQVEIIGLDDKRQITAVMACSLTGELLPLQLVYGGKTEKCHPRYTFPPDWHITHSPNHWANTSTTLEWISHVLVPFLVKKREDLQIPPEQPALCILDLFRAHRVEEVIDALKENNIRVAFVPGGCTGEVQPLDLSGNAEFKAELKQCFTSWYATQITSQPDDAAPIKIDVRLSALKPLHASWLVQSWKALRENVTAIISGWQQSGIVDGLEKAAGDGDAEGNEEVNIIIDGSDAQTLN